MTDAFGSMMDCYVGQAVYDGCSELLIKLTEMYEQMKHGRVAIASSKHERCFED